MTTKKPPNLIKLKIIFFSFYLVGLGVFLYNIGFLTNGYVSIKIFLDGLVSLVLIPLWLFGAYENFNGEASPIIFVWWFITDTTFLLTILYFWISRGKLNTLISYCILLVLTFITIRNFYAGTPWW